MSATNGEHLTRLLSLVPYFLANDGTDLNVAAEHFGISVAALVADLEQLSLSGLPGKYQDQMIDFYLDVDGLAHLTFIHGNMTRPLTLNSAEASVLLMGLHALAQTYAIDRGAVERAVAKVDAAVAGGTADGVESGGAPDDASPAPVDADGSPIYATITDALRGKRALRIRYYTASRDSIGERVIDPVRTQVVSGVSYLYAWCRESDDYRLFRYDRIDDAVALDEPARPPADVPQQPSAIFSDDSDLPTVTLDVDTPARWVFEYYPTIEPVTDMESDGADGAGTTRAVLRYGSDDWLVRFLLGFGGQIRIVADADPASEALAGRVRDTASAVRDRYR